MTFRQGFLLVRINLVSRSEFNSIKLTLVHMVTSLPVTNSGYILIEGYMKRLPPTPIQRTYNMAFKRGKELSFDDFSAGKGKEQKKSEGRKKAPPEIQEVLFPYA